MAFCGVAVFRVHCPGHDRPQHHRTDDEGEEKEENTLKIITKDRIYKQETQSSV